MIRLLQSLTPLIPALVLLAAASMARPWLAELPEPDLLLAELAPPLLLAVAAAMALRFNRSRVLFLVLVLALAYSLPFAYQPGSAEQARFLTAFLATALPLNIALFALLKERGVITFWGFTRLAWIGAQVAALAWTLGTGDPRLPAWLAAGWLDPTWLQWTPLPQPALGAGLLAALILLFRFLRNHHPLDGAFLGTLAATLWTLHLGGPETATVAYWSAAAAMLALGVVQETYHMAYLDELTGLPGRRALREALLKLGPSYTIAMLDVDHFKKFNDTYGHEAGDQVLRMVADRLRQVGGGGRPFRYGGEEFTVLFPGKGVSEVEGVLEELRQAVADRPFRVRGSQRADRDTQKRGRGGGQEVPVTISIGVAQRNAKRGRPEAVMEAADQALYKAKEKGRNRVVP